MKRYTGKNNIKSKSSIKSKIIKKLAIAGAIGILITIPVAKVNYAQNQVEAITENSELDVGRSFKNIKEEKMGKYLKNEINKLYEKYPNLDELMYNSSEETRSIEFINDIYRLYKALMVDESEKEVENIEGVKVTMVDQVVLTSDMITENDKIISKTYKGQNKYITDTYIQAKVSMDGAKLAKRMYEFLVFEVGLEPGVATSQEIASEIEDKGFYYDELTNKFYTKEGIAKLVSEKEIQSRDGSESANQEVEK